MSTTIKRSFGILEYRAAGDEVELSFSSELMIDGLVLDHSTNAADLSRLEAGVSPLLFEHKRDFQIGIIERAWIDEAAKKGRALVRFGTGRLAQDVLRDVKANIRRGVSVGFEVIREIAIAGGKKATKWRPYEISIVSVPADISVGVGRSLNTNPKMENENEENHDPIAAERERVSEIYKLARQHRQDAGSAITRGISVDEYRKEILSSFAQAKKREFPTPRSLATPNDGLAEQLHDDASRYSMVRAMHLAATGRPLDGIELEMHQELAKRSPDAPQGILVPLTAFSRSMTATGQTSTPGDQGGLGVQTSVGGMIDVLRKKLAVRGLGATVLTGLQGNLTLPRVTAATAATWKGEIATLDESNPLLDQISFSPKRLGTHVHLSKQLLIQSSPSINDWVQTDLLSALALAWETAAITGSGSSNQPLGILNTSGVGSVALGTNGGAPNWDFIVNLESQLTDIDANQGALGYLTNSKVRGKLKRTPIEAGTSAEKIWGTDGRLNGYAADVSNVVPANLVKGTSGAACSAMIFGNWNDLILAQWGAGLDLLVNPYARDTEGLVRITASMFVDVGIRRPQSFAVCKDILTT